MLLPRFTIRTLLAILTLCAFVFVVIGTAYRGHYWAWGVTIALTTLIVTMLVHAALFGVVWLFTQISPVPPGRTAASHFPNAAVPGMNSVDDDRGRDGPRNNHSSAV